MASAVLLAGVLLAASVSSSQSVTGGGGSEHGPQQGLGGGARSAISEGPRSSECQSTSCEGLLRERNSALAKVLDSGRQTDARPWDLLSTQSAPFSYVPKLYRVLGSVHSAPGDVISVAGAAHLEKMSNASLQMGTDSLTYAATFPPHPPPGGEKDLSSVSLDANLDLVELFYVFFKPNRLLATMSVAQPSRFTLRDTSQKVVQLVHNSLVASLQTSNKPPVISVVPSLHLDAGKFPIIMGVGDGTLCLCSEMAAHPVLRLQNRHIMDVYRDSSAAAKPFTFVCTFSGSTQRFESVAFPGWFLSTSQLSNMPVRLTNHLGATEITDFYFRKV